MAVLSRGLTFGATETVTNTKLHNLVDDATISGITDEDIDPSADINPSKIGDINVSNKVSGLSLFALPSTPAGAGRFPVWNMNLDIGASLASIPNTALIPLSMASLVHAIAIRSLASLPTTEQMPYNALVQSLASGGLAVYNGSNNFIGKNPGEVAPSLSNLIYCWIGHVNTHLYAGTGTAPATGSEVNMFLMIVSSITYQEVLNGKFLKIQGINTVTVKAGVWRNPSTSGDIQVSIGGQLGSAGIDSNTVNTEVSFTVDVSGLVNGTVYDISIGLKNDSGGAASRQYLGWIMMFGS